MKNHKVEFSWEDTGNLEVKIDGNMSATLRYRPSDKLIEETLAKLSKAADKPKKTLQSQQNQEEN